MTTRTALHTRTAPHAHTERPRAIRVEAPAPAAFRLNRRGRLVLRGLPLMLVAAVVTVVAVVTLSVGFSPAATSSDQAAPELRSLTVLPGDTLWDVAARVAPGQDRFATMDRIAGLNELEGHVLEPGAELFIPAER